MEKKARNIVTSSERSARLRALQPRPDGPRQWPPESGFNANVVLFHQTASISAPKWSIKSAQTAQRSPRSVEMFRLLKLLRTFHQLPSRCFSFTNHIRTQQTLDFGLYHFMKLILDSFTFMSPLLSDRCSSRWRQRESSNRVTGTFSQKHATIMAAQTNTLMVWLLGSCPQELLYTNPNIQVYICLMWSSWLVILWKFCLL